VNLGGFLDNHSELQPACLVPTNPGPGNYLPYCGKGLCERVLNLCVCFIIKSNLLYSRPSLPYFAFIWWNLPVSFNGNKFSGFLPGWRSRINSLINLSFHVILLHLQKSIAGLNTSNPFNVQHPDVVFLQPVTKCTIFTAIIIYTQLWDCFPIS